MYLLNLPNLLNLMKKNMLKINALLLTVFLAFAQLVQAHEMGDEAQPTSVAIYIQAQDYNHPIRLRSYSEGHWYSQGPMLEAAAVQVLGADFKEAAMCDTNPSAAKVLVWLRPRMFYNPQMQTYYGKVLAYAYTADGKPLSSYVGKAQKFGLFGVKMDDTLKTVYEAAMQATSAKMQADSKFQEALKGPSTALPCATTSLLPEPKIQFMSFQ